ncbi:hypothetical protein [Aquabacterium sp.]|uniref:hypothetical protein n=1 Tax=Aquabacterium sp. TaxID=1872578 RepID=UPI00378519D8
MLKPLAASLALALAWPMAARADTTTDISALRDEIAAIRAAYENRLRALEERLRAAEAATAAAPAAAAAAPPAPPPAPVAVPAAAGGSANAFNPALSLILSGTATRTSQDPSRYAITGFALPAGAEIGPGTRGFSLGESELGFAASIDPWWRGAANISLSPDDTVAVEEAWVQTTGLGNGLTFKAGRFFSSVGYLNSQHAHTWDFVDNPLAYQALLGTQYGDDGVQLAWIAPTDLYLELAAELGRGRSYPGSNTGRNGAGMAALALHAGGDVGDSHSWRAGLSVLQAKADDLDLTTSLGDNSSLTQRFTGRTRVWVADAVWKWAPGGNATRQNLKLQGEVLRSTRDGTLDMTAATRAVQSGWYLQGVWQFMPRWRVGLRTERLDPGRTDGLPTLASGFRPGRNSLMLDFSASEFSRLRLQVAQDRAREGVTDHQIFLQYQMSLGAHGAHSY